jgi:hypothetical protein
MDKKYRNRKNKTKKNLFFEIGLEWKEIFMPHFEREGGCLQIFMLWPWKICLRFFFFFAQILLGACKNSMSATQKCSGIW